MTVRPHSYRAAIAVALLWATIACGGGTPGAAARDERASTTPAVPEGSTATITDNRPRVVILGDSLTAGLGLQPGEAYPALLQQRVDAAGLGFQIVNAGVSGDTTAGGLSRLDWALEGDVRVLIVALGGNDGLRGLPAAELRKNLATIIERAQARHIRVILAGMEAPPNFGESYVAAFREVYPALAKQYQVTLVPFLLDGVAGSDVLNQADGIHPTAEGAKIVAGTVWRALQPAIEKGPPPK